MTCGTLSLTKWPNKLKRLQRLFSVSHIYSVDKFTLLLIFWQPHKRAATHNLLYISLRFWAQKSFCHKNKVLKFHEVLCCQKEIVFLRDAEMFVNNMFVSMLNLENMDTGMI